MAEVSDGFIFDIIFNQDDSFDALTINEYIMEYYGIDVPLPRIQSVIEKLGLEECVELDRCDKTADLFEGA